MNPAKLSLVTAALLTGAASAQNDNFLNRVAKFETNWAGYVFGGSTAVGGDALDTLFANELVDFGIDNATAPGQQLITGMQCVVQDQEPLTRASFNVVGYGENLTTRGQPDPARQLFNAGPIQNPAAPAGHLPATPLAWIWTIGFNTPVQTPREENTYIGMNLPPSTATGDILLMQFIDADTTHPAMPPIFSLPGQSYSSVPLGSHLIGLDPTAGTFAAHTLPGSMFVDVEVRGPGGHPQTNTNEVANPATQPPSNWPDVTTPHTAFYPDAVDFNTGNPARNDSAGYIYQDNAFVVGSDLVVFLIAFNLNPLNASINGGPLPISALVPSGNGTGNACIDLTVNATVAAFAVPTRMGAGTPPEQYFEISLPINAAFVTPGIQLVMQGFTFDGANIAVRGGPCSVQTF